MRKEDRKKVWVDQFQTKLTLRIGGYLLLFLIVLSNFLFAWRLMEEGTGDLVEQYLRMLRDYLPVGICLLLLVPVMAWDAIRFSHRIVGPIVRFRHTAQAVGNGEPVRPIKLREGDYLTEFRDDFNQMLDSLQRRGVPVLKPNDPGKDELGGPNQRTTA
jgi:nitrogen fixation/metabolism regulation signal transduction histidine kinase